MELLEPLALVWAPLAPPLDPWVVCALLPVPDGLLPVPEPSELLEPLALVLEPPAEPCVVNAWLLGPLGPVGPCANEVPCAPSTRPADRTMPRRAMPPRRLAPGADRFLLVAT